jgi:MSHA pilin protein MshD
MPLLTRSLLQPSGPRPPRHPRRAGGFTLIELVLFIAVASAGLTGVLRVFIDATLHSADPMQRRQSLAIAESLLEEVQLMPFTFCDGDDPQVETASSPGNCANGADALGPEPGENRFATPQFDHVNDYHGYAMNGAIVDITNTPVAGLAGYSASVSVAAAALSSITAASGDALRITVTVTSPNGQTLSLDGYRTRHAPNASL